MIRLFEGPRYRKEWIEATNGEVHGAVLRRRLEVADADRFCELRYTDGVSRLALLTRLRELPDRELAGLDVAARIEAHDRGPAEAEAWLLRLLELG